MENTTVEFSIREFRNLLNEKSQKVGKLLYDLEQLGDYQNKAVIDKLLEGRILTVVNGQTIASGYKLTPDDGKEFTKEENDSNLEAVKKTSEIFVSYGGKNTVKIELDVLKDLLFDVNQQDVVSCISNEKPEVKE